MEALAAEVEADPRPLEVSRRRLRRQSASKLPRVVVEAGNVVLDELEGVRLVAAAKVDGAVLAPALGEPELDTPAQDGFLEIGNPEADVVDSAES
jgi:hypothetical protein